MASGRRRSGGSSFGLGTLGFSGGAGGYKELWRKARPLIPIFAVTIIGGFLAFLFEFLPKPQSAGQQQSFMQITRDVFHHLSLAGFNRTAVAASLVRLSYTVPVWLPLWSVKRPRAVFDSRVPPTALIERDAWQILGHLDDLSSKRYFRIFKIDFDAQCPFWVRNDVCTAEGACTVCHCDDDQIPEVWKQNPTEQFVDRRMSLEHVDATWGGDLDVNSLDHMSEESASWRGPNNIFDSVSDEHAKSAAYVDLSLNKPKNTGFVRTPIWTYIYKENCMGQMANPLISEGPGDDQLGDKCMEEDAFYKVISGMQSAISILLAENFNESLPPSVPFYKRWFQPKFNLSFYRRGIAARPDWAENLYFSFSLLMRSICKVHQILEQCSCETGIPEEVADARASLARLLQKASSLSSCEPSYLETPIFQRKSSLALRQFRNITRIMDCVDCQSCRLHAKIKVLALYMALKATSSPNILNSIERNELIALVNGAHYFAEAVIILKKFQLRHLLLRIGLAVATAVFAVLIAFTGIKMFRMLRQPQKSAAARAIETAQRAHVAAGVKTKTAARHPAR